MPLGNAVSPRLPSDYVEIRCGKLVGDLIVKINVIT